MKKILFLFASLFLFFVLINLANAADIAYPVPELGNCNSEAECEVYCDNVDNMEVCFNFAEKTGLMTAAELAEARKFMPLMKSGNTPGGCKAHECKAYCDDESHINECVDFAVRAGIIPAEEAAMVKKTGGKGPGGCKGKEACDAFCNNDANFNVCIDFAKEYGLISAEDYEMAKKTGGKGPGGCKGQQECDAFCNTEANINVCVDFAVEHGMMSAEDAEMAKKTGGKGPGGCRSEEACDAYCKENMEECKKWGEEHGLVFEQKDNGPGGPGGCKSEEECKAFCNDPANMQTCMEFSVKEGKMSQEEYENVMEQNRKAAEGPPPDTSTPPMEWEEGPGPEGQEPGTTPGTEPGTAPGTEPGTETPPSGDQSPPSGSEGNGGAGIGEGGSDTGGSSDSGSSEGSSSGDSGSSGGGESAPATGGVISEENSNNNWLLTIIRFIFGI